MAEGAVSGAGCCNCPVALNCSNTAVLLLRPTAEVGRKLVAREGRFSPQKLFYSSFRLRNNLQPSHGEAVASRLMLLNLVGGTLRAARKGGERKGHLGVSAGSPRL